MAKTTGKLKYDLALSTTTVYDASAVYVNKSAELSINGNANLQYKTIGPTYADNVRVIPNTSNFPGPSSSNGKAYLYMRNLGPTDAAEVRVSFTNVEDTTDANNDGLPDLNDPSQYASLAKDEFAFFPVSLGASNTNIHVRSGFIAGSTFWTGPTSNEIEYMLCFVEPNTGPNY